MASPRGASFSIGLNAVILAVTGESPRVLVVDGEGGEAALPFDLLDPESERTLELALRVRVREETGLELPYVEQLYTFGDRDRDPRVRRAGVRPISIGYLALVREAAPSAGAAWRDVYRFLPWEDWRAGRPPVLDPAIVPALDRWVAAGTADRRQRRERADIAFGLGGAPWHAPRVLERYELLYEAGAVAEAAREDGGGGLGEAMSLDHRRMLATALARIRGKLAYRPVVFELLPPTFTLLQLLRVVEALAGVRLHKGNFRRLVERGGLVEGTGEETPTGGRPAELFRFRREVLRERPAPGVGLPRSAG
ncbi:MAG TPA: NAD regulator [Thermoanaerobaculia bacterium]